MSKQYKIKFVTKGEGSDPGTNSDVDITLYDIDGNMLGGSFEVTSTLHDNYGNALKAGSTQVGLFTPPFPETFSGTPAPVFIKVEIKGDDQWHCDQIMVKPVKNDGNSNKKFDKYSANNYPSVFTLNKPISTGEGEGGMAADVSVDGYSVEGIQVGENVTRVATTFSIDNNAYGTTSSTEMVVTVRKVNTEVISFAQEEGDKHSNSISVGVETGFGLGPTKNTVSTTYSSSWEDWKKTTNTSLYQAERSEEKTITLTAPPHTVRISQWDVPFIVSTFSVKNGFGNPVNIDIVPDQRIFVPARVIIDINGDNPISQTRWSNLMERMRASDSINEKTITQADQTLKQKGWIQN
jgi:hypothetical protein